jgi:hypothetical protein
MISPEQVDEIKPGAKDVPFPAEKTREEREHQ